LRSWRKIIIFFVFLFLFCSLNAVEIDWIVVKINNNPMKEEKKIKKDVFRKCPSSIYSFWILKEIFNSIPKIEQGEAESLSVTFIESFPTKCVEVTFE